MRGEARPAYLAGLRPEEAQRLAAVNTAGLKALRSSFRSVEAVAFLGAGTSAPLYPLWADLISELVDAAAEQGLEEEKAVTCRALAKERPDAVVELLRRHLGPARYQAALREAFRVRRDPETGRTWTPTQELVCRCPFKAVVTTNYDPGIIAARMRVRVRASGTGFASWTDELALDRWRTGDVFGDEELPVLFAHGHHNQPDAMVLAATEYRRAYAGKLSAVLGRILDAWHLVWIGFSFTDQRISGLLQEVAEHSGTRIDPGRAPRHVVIMAWDPGSGNDPQTLRALAEIEYGADLVLYPASRGDHSALQRLLADFVVDDYPPAPDTPAPRTAVRSATVSSPAAPTRMSARYGSQARATPSPAGLPVGWVPPAEVVEHFTGRVEELARLDRWAADPTVRLVGVTAWGGAGKTALVTHWIDQVGGVTRRPGVWGIFGWSFYADASAEHWAEALLEWAKQEFGVLSVLRGHLAAAVLALLEQVPLLLVLDGLEVLQEGPEGAQFGRLLDGTLREVLTGACRVQHAGLVMLTSRFAFADLEGFDGGAARILDVPPFTPSEGAALLAVSGGGWLAEAERRDLVNGVDGHALAVAALGGALRDRPPTTDLEALRAELAAAATTNARVAKVLRFYAARLSEADRYLVAAVALFAHPITPDAVLAVAGHATFGGRLEDWGAQQVEAAARDRLTGLLSWHPDRTMSAHPLVRDTFRPLAMGAAEVAAEATLTGVSAGTITSREDGLRVVEAIELLLDANQWLAADDLYKSRTDDGKVWDTMPAARLGQRSASAFVATQARRQACINHLSHEDLGYYLNAIGLQAMRAGDLITAQDYLDAGAQSARNRGILPNLSTGLRNLTQCRGSLGEVEAARKSAETAAMIAAIKHPLMTALSIDPSADLWKCEAHRGWVSFLGGDTPAAEAEFTAADRLHYTSRREGEGGHMFSLPGIWWGEFLARTGRSEPARWLTKRNYTISLETGSNSDVARSERLLGYLDLAAGDIGSAGRRLTAAAATFRDGDYLVELAATLPVLADFTRARGDLDAADRYVEEAMTIAGPRGLLLSQAVALTVRARAYADRVASGSRDHLWRGRDAAEAALRIATRHRLSWQELDALDAHVRLDQVEGVDHGWRPQATALRTRLIPAGLDPDPSATVELRGRWPTNRQ